MVQWLVESAVRMRRLVVAAVVAVVALGIVALQNAPRDVYPEFEPPAGLRHPRFVLEPLGPQHNDRDYAAWTSSMDHIHSTPGLTETSLLPQAAEAAGIGFDHLIDRILRAAHEY